MENVIIKQTETAIKHNFITYGNGRLISVMLDVCAQVTERVLFVRIYLRMSSIASLSIFVLDLLTFWKIQLSVISNRESI